MKNYLSQNIKNIINSKNKESNFSFHLNEFAKKFALDQVEKWVNSLIRCLQMKKNVEYIINKNREIIPVDQDNTGVLQKKTSLSYGLQQFLQMKNNLPITPISILTNYLSNLGFFKRYIKSNGNFIYGMTGTLGSKTSRELLGNVYNLEFDYIPPNSPRILRELTSCICFDFSKWIENIIRVVKRETNYGRGILLICENIDSVNNIYNEIKNNCSGLKLIKIIGEDNEDLLIPKEMKPKTVIISTNISGRGTDIKLGAEILKKGGLHVIITFIPNNSRVEEQNYGRAGRKGEPGTWQLILNYQDTMNKFYLNYFNNFELVYSEYFKCCQNENIIDKIKNKFNSFSIEFIRETREKRELNRMENAMKYIEKVDIEDKLFNEYCKMIEERPELRKPENKIYLDSIEERWAIFFYNLDIKDKTWEIVKIDFDKFKREIMNDYDNNKVIKNPGYYNKYVNNKLSAICDEEREKSILDEIKEGIKNVVNSIKDFFKGDKEKYNFNECLEKFNLSIKIDENSFIPYFLRGISKILAGQNGVDDLKMSDKKITDEISNYCKRLVFFTSLNMNIEFDFYQIQILNNVKKTIIEKSIDNYLKFKDNVKINKKKFKEVFSFKENNGKKNDREIPHYYKKYFDILCDNGLENVFFFTKKVSKLKLIIMVTLGFALVGLSIGLGITTISAFSCLSTVLKGLGITSSIVGATLGLSSIFNGVDDLIKGEHDRQFPGSYDVGFFSFLKERKKIRKFEEVDINEIFNKYDLDFQNKKIKEDEEMFKKELLKKIKKIGFDSKNLYNDEEKNKEKEKNKESL